MLPFDTSDKKPKLYDLLILALAVGVFEGVLVARGDYRSTIISAVVAIVFTLLCFLRLLAAFWGQIRYNPYSYNTIYYIGFALFVLSILITHILLLRQTLLYPEFVGGPQTAWMLLRSAKNYMFITFPFLLVYSVLLCVSNIALIRHEGRRLVNVLGILLSVLLVGGAVLIYALDFYVSGSQFEVMMHDLFVNLLSAVYLYFECMLIGSIIANLIVVKYEPKKDKDYLIILGCGLQKDGRPTPLLKGRIDRALAFYRQQKEETGRELIFITSGGQGKDEVISESASMKQYLIAQGIPGEQIIEEDRSESTFENMQFSRKKIEEAGGEGKVAFSTTNYHVFRSGLYARRVKMRAVGMGAKTKWYFWPNAAVREFVGILTEHRAKQALVLGSLVLAYVLLTIAVYR